MKTLKSECERNWSQAKVIADGYVGPSALDVALGPYGDWRVAEGELYLEDGRVGVLSSGHTEGHEWEAIDPIGHLYDHVKLIIPPEEKKDATPLVLQMTKLELAEAQARADRYKKALRDIAGMGWPSLMMRDRVTLLRKIAREALDE